MSTINTKLCSNNPLDVSSIDVTIDLEYGSIALNGDDFIQSEDNIYFFFIYDGEKFIVIKEGNGIYFVADDNLDDLRNQAMG